MDAFTVPSGQVPIAYGEQPRRLRGLATALTVLFAGLAVILVGAGLTMLFRSWLAYRVVAGAELSTVVATRVDALVVILVVLQVAISIIVGVVFIVWQYKHAKNARLLGHRGELGPEWAIGGWFIPVANFVLPGVQLFSTSRHSDPQAAAAPGRRGRGQPIVPIWAVVLGVGGVLGAIGSLPTDDPGFAAGDDSVTRRIAALNLFGGIGALILAVAAVLALVMVRRLSTLQERALGLTAPVAVAAWPQQPGWPQTPPQPTAAWPQTPPAPAQTWPPATPPVSPPTSAPGAQPYQAASSGTAWTTPAGLPSETPVWQPPVAQPPVAQPPAEQPPAEPPATEPRDDGPPTAPPPPPPPA